MKENVRHQGARGHGHFYDEYGPPDGTVVWSRFSPYNIDDFHTSSDYGNPEEALIAVESPYDPEPPTDPLQGVRERHVRRLLGLLSDENVVAWYRWIHGDRQVDIGSSIADGLCQEGAWYRVHRIDEWLRRSAELHVRMDLHLERWPAGWVCDPKQALTGAVWHYVIDDHLSQMEVARRFGVSQGKVRYRLEAASKQVLTLNKSPELSQTLHEIQDGMDRWTTPFTRRGGRGGLPLSVDT